MTFLPVNIYFKGLKAIKDFKSLKGRILEHLIFYFGGAKMKLSALGLKIRDFKGFKGVSRDIKLFQKV